MVEEVKQVRRQGSWSVMRSQSSSTPDWERDGESGGVQRGVVKGFDFSGRIEVDEAGLGEAGVGFEIEVGSSAGVVGGPKEAEEGGGVEGVDVDPE